MARGGAPRCYINITTGESLSISAFVSDTVFFQIKASEFMDLIPQYGAYCRAWDDFPALVPRPLGHSARNGWSIMVTEGKHHVMARAAELLPAANHEPGTLARGLLNFFETSARHAGNHPFVDAADDLDGGLTAHFESSPMSRVASYWIEQSRESGLHAMAAVPQHGDFVFNNLASSAGRLVVFDWEDYGRCCLPGLDIFTLCLSLLEEKVAALRAMMDGAEAPHSPVEHLLRHACEIQKIPLPLFRRLVPFYLLVFLYLKRNYGVSVQQRMSALLVQLTPAGMR